MTEIYAGDLGRSIIYDHPDIVASDLIGWLDDEHVELAVIWLRQVADRLEENAP